MTRRFDDLRHARPPEPNWVDALLAGIAFAIFAVAFLAMIYFWMGVGAAHARWKEDYSKASPEVRAWYQRQLTTPETRNRINAAWYKFCCDDADTVEAKVDKIDGHWFYQLPGETEWQPVPDDTVQDSVMTPFGKPVLFVDATSLKAGPVCFFPGGSGM